MPTSGLLDITIGGTIWWGGFTAELTITNSSGRDLNHWSYSFESPHQLNTAPWGAELEALVLDNGLTRYTLTGSGWGQSIPAGGTITVGFNAEQGTDLGTAGELTAELLLAQSGSASLQNNTNTTTPPPSAAPETEASLHDMHSHEAHSMHGAASGGEFTDITTWGTFHGSNHNSEHNELVGGRTAITTEALLAYNGLRRFAGLDAVDLDAVGEWAFAQGLTNNSQPGGNDVKGVGLWYAMQGAKVGWIADELYDPQIVADIQRTARLGSATDVMAMTRAYGHEGFADYIETSGLTEAFINTLKMEPHYGGWMHGRTHGFLDIEGVAIAHDINHLTVLGWDQRQPFMNDTFDWPQWPALEVSDATVINYYQGIVSLGNPLDQNLEALPGRIASIPSPVPFPGALLPDPEPVEAEPGPVEGADIEAAKPGEGSDPDLDAAELTQPASQTRSPLDVQVGGSIWWGGFTAELAVTNTSADDLENWSFSFDSQHGIQGQPWGATASSIELDSGLIRHTISGAEWGRSIGAGETVVVGFNGSQDNSIGTNGVLSEALLFSATSLESSPPFTQQEQPKNPAVPNEQIPGSPNQESNRASIGIDDTSSYQKALELSLLFYEANRSGDLDEASNRIAWRGDSGLNDGRDGIYFGDLSPSNLQTDLNLDLTGGYHDAGDHVKFGLPLASTLSTLAWGGIAFAKGYQIAEQTDQLLSTVRWGTDYLLKAHQLDSNGETEFFIAQVGDGQADHALWSSPENQSIDRPALAITAEKPGSDVAAASAAAMASASILFRNNGDTLYADTLLNEATALFDFALEYQGKYSDSIASVQPFYNSWSGYQDELVYGALWLARGLEAAGQDGSQYQSDAQNRYHTAIGGLNQSWAPNWDDASYGAAVLLGQDLNDQKALSDVTAWLDSWVTGDQGPQITEGGLRFVDQWGSLRYSANTAMLAGVVADSIVNPEGAYSQLAVNSMDYILGNNPRESSYIVGFGDNWPEQPHHRAASGVGWKDFNSLEANEHILYGALVGGPSRADDFSYTDRRSDYISNEVAIDYNAGLTGALAFATQLG